MYAAVNALQQKFFVAVLLAEFYPSLVNTFENNKPQNQDFREYFTRNFRIEAYPHQQFKEDRKNS